MENKKTFKADILLIAGLFAAGAVIFLILALTSGNGEYVQVRIDGRTDTVYSLSENRREVIKGEGGTNTLVIENGEAFISEADCPDGLCRNMGKISRKGQSIVCLPHKVVIEITDSSGSTDNSSDIDIIAK